MRTPTRYPLILRMMTGLGRVWLSALILLILTPLINDYSLSFGIPLLSDFTNVIIVMAVLVMCLCVPLSWGLGCASLILEWMGRHSNKRKRKLKRKSRSADRIHLATADYKASAGRLAEPPGARGEPMTLNLRRFRQSELAPGSRSGSQHGGD